jgi:predicted nucleic acid-binding protein
VRVVGDTGPIVAAANRRDRAHGLAAALVSRLGRELLVPMPVAVEVDQLLRARVGVHSAAAFLRAMVAGEHTMLFLSSGLLRRAVEIDATHAALDLGLADATVMAVAERDRLPILTFDFEDFRAVKPKGPAWSLVVDQSRYRRAASP